MSATLARDVLGPPRPPVDNGWGGGDNPGGRGADRRASFAGLYILLAASTMVFAAFTTAFVVRRNFSDFNDWVSVHKPPVLFVNTAILLVSSCLLEFSRRALRSGDRDRFNRWWSAGAGAGVLFLAGQALAWFELQKAGVFVSTNPASSFFYVLTASHALHLIGGLAVLLYVAVQAHRLRLGPAKRTFVDVSAIFWHFLAVVWIYLMVLLYVWG